MRKSVAKKRKIVIDSCEQCPSLEVLPVHTGDSFEVVVKWVCRKLKKTIRGPFDLPSEWEFPIPKECPLDKE